MTNLLLQLLRLPIAAERRRSDVEYAEDRRSGREDDLDAYYRAGVDG